MNTRFPKVVALLLCVCMIIGLVPMTALAAVEYATDDTYYNVISKDDYEIAPGITESEIVLNNDDGTRRQVLHVMEADVSNPYVTVIPSSKGMVPTAGQYGVQIMSEQAAYAEANGYGNVVGAMNISLSWYNNDYYAAHPELVGEPLGYLVLNGQYFENSLGKTSGAQTCLVINFDEKDGVARPSNVPKTEIRSTSSAITGWEEQVIPANFGFLVKDGVAVNTTENHTGGASRSMLGIKEDGTVVMVMNDGRQSPYSEGLNDYEMSKVMLDLGCVYAINGDGGGSSTFLSQRPGEELALHCSPSDGAERPTTHGVLVISSAPATGEFVRASISSANDYYTPNSQIPFVAVGSDLVGTAAEIPADATWQLADDSFGTIDANGVFTSNGKVGDVTVQLVWDGEVVGSDTIHVVLPDTVSLGQASITAPYGRDIYLDVTALYDSKNVVLKDGDISLMLSDANMGTLNGYVFTATDDTAVTSGTITAAVVGTNVSITVDVVFGKGSEVLFDFENDAASGWKNNMNTTGVTSTLAQVTEENGQVRFGNGALAVTTDYTQSNSQGGWIYAGLNLNQEEDIIIPAEATSWGIWVYVPEEAVGGELDFRPYHNVNGKYSRIDLVLFGNGYATTFDESGWHYVSVDISSLGELVIPGTANNTVANGQSKAFIELYNPDGANSAYGYTGYKDYSSINGKFTYYFDDMTIDFSNAVDDREEPVFEYMNAAYGELDESVAVEGQTIGYNQVIFSAKVAENTAKANYTGLNFASAKAYVDGIDLTDKMTVGPDGSLSMAELTLADGVHTVKFSIEDNMGNYTSIIRQINVQAASGMDTIKVVPHNGTLDKILIGSLYYMDVVTTDASKVQEVIVKIDLNNSNTWEPQGLVVADGFEATCTVDSLDEIATIVITKTGSVAAGETVLVSIPARTMKYDRQSYDATLTPEAIWAAKTVWPLDLQFTVKYGELTQVDGTVSSFSATKHYVDTENYLGRYTATADYWNAKTTWHLHTAEAVADLDATCTKAGYTGRTFCAVCNSVVDWGTIIPATGHDYQVIGGALKCVNSCGELFNGVLEGKTYIDGVVASGWVDNTYYYVDGVALTGSHFMDGTMYTFDASGVYQPNYVYDGWFEINDTVMYFVSNNYLTGPHKLGTEYYNFDANGFAFDGEVVLGDQVCVFDNGVSVETDTVLLAGMCGEKAAFVIYQDGRMVISGEGDMVDYKSVGSVPWYASHRYEVSDLYIGKDITSIGVRAFYNLYYLETITFEEGSVLTSIDGYGFGMNSKLSEVILPETVTYIGEPAFRNCVNLKKVYIPAATTFIGPNAFYQSTNVTLNVAEGSYAESYAISKKIAYTTYEAPAKVIATGVSGDTTWTYDSKGVLTIGGIGAMADYEAKGTPWEAYRTQVKKVVIGEGVTYIGKFAFYYMSSLTDIVFAENGALETIGWGSFGYCNKLSAVTIPATVKSLNGYAFYFCTNLADVSFAAGSKLESIEQYAFKGDTGLKTFFVPDGVTLIGPGAFLNCQNTATFNVAEGSYAHDFFKNNKIVVREAIPVIIASGVWGDTTWTYNNLGVLTISGNGAMADCETKCAPWESFRTRIKKVVIGEGVTYIGKFNFYYMSSLTDVEFAANGALETIGWGSFGYCRALTSITLPASVKTLDGYALYYCTSLTDVNFAEGSLLRTISQYAFKKDTALKNVFIPDGVTVIGPGAFEGSQSTATFYVAENSFAHAFFAKNNIVVREALPVVLERGTWGDTTWTFDNGGVLTVSGNGAMADCAVKSAPWEAFRTQIKKVVIGEGVTYIGKFNFYYCNNLKEIEFAANGALKTIGWGSFGYCRALTSVTLPASVEVVDNYAFYYCGNLTSFGVAEGSKLTSIGQYCFKADSALTSISIPEGTKIGAGAFLDTPLG